MKNLKIFLAFFIAAILGTLLHECGHILVSLLTGCKSFHLGYAYMHPLDCNYEYYPPLTVLGEAYNQTVIHKLLWITLGGPLQTNLTGLLGIFLLYRLSRRRAVDAWKGLDLFYIVLAYFLSRNIFNGLTGFLHIGVAKGRGGSVGDETKIFHYFGIDSTIGHVSLMLIATALLAYVTFVLVRHHRLQLILWGGLGSIAGVAIWMRWWGPLLLP